MDDVASDNKIRPRPHLGPLADGVEVDAAVDERGGQLAAPALQRVGAQRHRPLRLVRLQQLRGVRAQVEVEGENRKLFIVCKSQALSPYMYALCTRVSTADCS